MKHDNLMLNLNEEVLEILEIMIKERNTACDHVFIYDDPVFVEKTLDKPAFIYQNRSCDRCSQYEQSKEFYYTKKDYLKNKEELDKLYEQVKNSNNENDVRIVNIIDSWRSFYD